MSISDIVSELERMPKGAGRAKSIVEYVNSNRHEIAAQLRGTRLTNPVDEVDSYFAVADETLESKENDPNLRRLASLYFKTSYDGLLRLLDTQVRLQGELTQSSSQLISQMRPRPEDNRPYMGEVRRLKQGIVQDHKQRRERTITIVGEMVMLKRLVQIYTSALLEVQGKSYLLVPK